MQGTSIVLLQRGGRRTDNSLSSSATPDSNGLFQLKASRQDWSHVGTGLQVQQNLLDSSKGIVAWVRKEIVDQNAILWISMEGCWVVIHQNSLVKGIANAWQSRKALPVGKSAPVFVIDFPALLTVKALGEDKAGEQTAGNRSANSSPSPATAATQWSEQGTSTARSRGKSRSTAGNSS